MMKGREEIRRGQIYYTNLGEGEGSELRKVRPCLVVQNDVGNTHSPTTIVVPITHRRNNRYIPTQVELKKNMFAEEMEKYVDGVIMAEQVRVVSKTRLKDFIGELIPEAIKVVEDAIRISIGMD